MRLGLGLVVIAVACGGDASSTVAKETPPPAKVAPAQVPPAEAAATRPTPAVRVQPPQQRAQHWLSAAAEDAAGAVDWKAVGHVNALRLMILVESGKMDELGDREQQLARMIETVQHPPAGAELDGGAFAEHWTPHRDCEVVPATSPPLKTLPAALVAKLPDEMKATVDAMASATHLQATCGDDELLVSFAVDGRIVYVGEPEGAPIEPADADNELLKYMDEPDEVPGG